MKKHLKTIALYGGTFVLLNFAMFLVLKFTQPSPAPSELAFTHADSTGTAESHEESATSESTSHSEHEQAVTDSNSLAATENTSTHTETIALDSIAQTTQGEPHIATTVDSGLVTHDEIAHGTEETAPLQDQEVALDESQDATTGQQEQRSTAEIAKLAKLLEGMKPAEAATIAEGLPTDTIVELVMRMKARSGAKMMASLPVPVAASVAERMAELSGAKKSS